MSRAFLATPRHMGAEATETYLSHIVGKMGVPENRVDLAEKVFEDSFASLGGWQEWIEFVATGVDFLSREPRYLVIFCVVRDVGRATAQIVGRALEAGKLVAFMEENPDEGLLLWEVRGVETVDSENWQQGWRLSIGRFDDPQKWVDQIRQLQRREA